MHLLTLGTSKAHEVKAVMDSSLDVHHDEMHAISGARQTLADALPALGIFAAVLGMIHSMGSIAESPELLAATPTPIGDPWPTAPIASRRALIDVGLKPGRLLRTPGAADQEPYDSKNPDNPSNRRISVALLRRTGEQEEKQMKTKEEPQEQQHEQSYKQPIEPTQKQPPAQ